MTCTLHFPYWPCKLCINMKLLNVYQAQELCSRDDMGRGKGRYGKCKIIIVVHSIYNLRNQQHLVIYMYVSALYV